jgi:two-component system KDP operon response regulator KdpE
MSAGRVLVVDDEPQIRRVLRMALTDHSYEVEDARSGEEAMEKISREKFDLILLDMNMPGMGGIATCRALREKIDAVIIMVTVRNTEVEKVACLDAGADDYVTKPFGMPELLARIRAALRRASPNLDSAPKLVQIGDAELDFVARAVRRGGVEYHLTPKEFDLMHYLLTHANKAVSHRELLQHIWGPDYGGEVEYLRVFVKQLRKKIEPEPAKPRYLLTEPWFGYRLQLE